MLLPLLVLLFALRERNLIKLINRYQLLGVTKIRPMILVKARRVFEISFADIQQNLFAIGREVNHLPRHDEILVLNAEKPAEIQDGILDISPPQDPGPDP